MSTFGGKEKCVLKRKKSGHLRKQTTSKGGKRKTGEAGNRKGPGRAILQREDARERELMPLVREGSDVRKTYREQGGLGRKRMSKKLGEGKSKKKKKARA